MYLCPVFSNGSISAFLDKIQVKTLYCIAFHNISFMTSNRKKQLKIIFKANFKGLSENKFKENVNCIVIVYYFASSFH